MWICSTRTSLKVWIWMYDIQQFRWWWLLFVFDKTKWEKTWSYVLPGKKRQYYLCSKKPDWFIQVWKYELQDMMFNKYVGDGYCLILTWRNNRKHEATWCWGKKIKLTPILDCNNELFLIPSSIWWNVKV
jgi:hypothetical protein